MKESSTLALFCSKQLDLKINIFLLHAVWVRARVREVKMGKFEMQRRILKCGFFFPNLLIFDISRHDENRDEMEVEIILFFRLLKENSSLTMTSMIKSPCDVTFHDVFEDFQMTRVFHHLRRVDKFENCWQLRRLTMMANSVLTTPYSFPHCYEAV